MQRREVIVIAHNVTVKFDPALSHQGKRSGDPTYPPQNS
jgi:hypothetical protein